MKAGNAIGLGMKMAGNTQRAEAVKIPGPQRTMAAQGEQEKKNT
jgi:hypothetical protein